MNRLRGELAALTAERDALRSEVETLRPQTEEYQSVKTRIAELELAAHRRAEEYEAEVYGRADDYETDVRKRADDYEAEVRERADAYDRGTRATAAELLGDCRAQVDLILATLDETCANVTAELLKSTETVSRLPDAFHTLRHDLNGLGEIE